MPLIQKFKKYHFEWKHLLVLFMVLIFFQIIVSYIQKISLQDLLVQTQDWYKQDAAEKLANLTTTSLELLLETSSPIDISYDEKGELVEAFNILLSQQIIQHNVEDICILITHADSVHAIDNGRTLFNYLYRNEYNIDNVDSKHQAAVNLYRGLQDEMQKNERIISVPENQRSFHVFVPLVPNGEYSGAVYLKILPDFSFISRKITSSYDETALIFSALILFGLLTMFYISSYTVKERDEAQRQLYKEHEKYLMEQINHKKETLFTKRIYHTHHKAEKIMGFIKEDLSKIEPNNISEIKYRISKFANFISRVIYDMKWYDPPLLTIRNPRYRTNLNEVLQFIVDAIFMRVPANMKRVNFEINLDEKLPPAPINEFVVWEIVEPLIQNCIDHADGRNVHIKIITNYSGQEKRSLIFIDDNGQGILPELLTENENGVKKIFLENMSTKPDKKNAGYGCYLAYEVAKRCGWHLDARNLESGGCRFVLTIKNVN